MRNRGFLTDRWGNKRSSPKEQIESKSSKFEDFFVKPSRAGLIYATKEHSNIEVMPDSAVISEVRKKFGDKFQRLHTHLYDYRPLWALPDPRDIEGGLSYKSNKPEVIAQRDRETGKFMGYTMIFPKKKEDKENSSEKTEISNLTDKYITDVEKVIKNFKAHKQYDMSTVLNSLRNLLSANNLDIRFHPARDYYFDKNTGCYEKKGQGLEKTVASIIIGLSLLGLAVKVPFTGAVIGSSVNDSMMNIFRIGGLFFLIILVILLSRRNKTSKKLKE